MKRILLVISLFAAAGPALAQSTESQVKEFGLLGTWAGNCAKPPAKDNIHSTYTVKDGAVVNIHNAGSTFVEDVYVLRSAKPTGIDLLLLQSVGRDGKETLITMRKIGDKVQVWRVVASDGKVPVNDGKFTVNDAVIPALSRCQ